MNGGGQPIGEHVMESAGIWVMRVASGALDAQQSADFAVWMAADAAHGRAYGRALAVWHNLHAVRDAPDIVAKRAEALDALRRGGQRRWTWKPSVRLGGLAAIAASLCLVVMTLVWFGLGSGPVEYATGLGERRTVMLADGSQLSLDAESRVDVRYDEDRRALTLFSGRAKFDVAHDTKRPFSVRAGNRTVVAVGTTFSIELVDGIVDVIVYDGKVRTVAHEDGAAESRPSLRSGGEVILTRGDELRAASSGDDIPRIARTDAARSLSWESGQLDFVDEPLSTAIDRLNRHSAIKLVAVDPPTRAITVNGVFNVGDSEAFVEALAETYALRATRQGSTIRLSAR